MNTYPATYWALNNSGLINLKITQYQWSEKLGFFDFGVSIKINEINSIGRGSDCERGLALEKAVSEAIERIFSQTYTESQIVKSVCGFAVHSDPEKALEFAKKEFIERSVFYKNYCLKNIKLKSLTGEMNNPLLNKLRHFGGRDEFYIYEILIKNPIISVVIVFARSISGKRYLATSAESNAESAVLHAQIEVLRNLSFDRLQSETNLKFRPSKEEQILNSEKIYDEFESWVSIVTDKKFISEDTTHHLNGALLYSKVIPLSYLYNCPLFASVAFEHEGLEYLDNFKKVRFMEEIRWNPLI